MGTLKNKSGKRGVFFEFEKRPSTHHVSTSNPPQIHHKKTTSNHPFLPKPPAKSILSCDTINLINNQLEDAAGQ